MPHPEYLQSSFDFPFSENYNAEDFLVTKENRQAFDFINNYNSQNPLLPASFALIGSQASGKTHLSKIWQKKQRAIFLDLAIKNDPSPENQFYIIEDIDQIDDQKNLFHIFNNISASNKYLLLTSSVPLQNLEYQFADLKSRLINLYSIKIENPDQELIRMLLIKNFSRQQLLVEDAVINFLVKNIERNYAAIQQISRLLEFYCFEQKSKITIPLAKKALEIFNIKNANSGIKIRLKTAHID